MLLQEDMALLLNLYNHQTCNYNNNLPMLLPEEMVLK